MYFPCFYNCTSPCGVHYCWQGKLIEESINSAKKPYMTRFHENPNWGFAFFFLCSRAIILKVLAKQRLTSQVVITLINNGRIFLAEFNFQCVFRCILAPFCSFRTIGWFILFGLVCLSPFLWHCTGQDSLGITLINGLFKLLPPEQYSFCRQTTGAVAKPRESKVDRFIAAFFKFSERCQVTLNQERPKQPGSCPLWLLFSLLAIWYADLSTWRLVLQMVRVCGLDSGYVINIFCYTKLS